MHGFIAKLEHMQRTQDRHLQRLGSALSSISRSVRSRTAMITIAEELQTKEEQRLDPAARELSHLIPPEYEHHDRAIDRLTTLIGVMTTSVSTITLAYVEESVKAGFELIIMIDDVDFAAVLTDQGRDLHAMHVLAQFLCALKGWIVVTERLIERTAKASFSPSELKRIAGHLGHVGLDAYHYPHLHRATRKRSRRRPQEPRPPAAE